MAAARSAGRRVGWAGRLADRPTRPPCPHCDRAALRVEVQRQRALDPAAVRGQPAGELTGRELAAARAVAGLSMGDAADALGLGSVARIVALESTPGRPLADHADLTARVGRLYGLGEPQPAGPPEADSGP